MIQRLALFILSLECVQIHLQNEYFHLNYSQTWHLSIYPILTGFESHLLFLNAYEINIFGSFAHMY